MALDIQKKLGRRFKDVPVMALSRRAQISDEARSFLAGIIKYTDDANLLIALGVLNQTRIRNLMMHKQFLKMYAENEKYIYDKLSVDFKMSAINVKRIIYKINRTLDDDKRK